MGLLLLPSPVYPNPAGAARRAHELSRAFSNMKPAQSMQDQIKAIHILKASLQAIVTANNKPAIIPNLNSWVNYRIQQIKGIKQGKSK